MALNRNKVITTDIYSQNGAFTGNMEVYEVNGPSVKSMNDFGKTEVQTVKKPAIKPGGAKFQYSFPPHSFTMLKGKIERKLMRFR